MLIVCLLKRPRTLGDSNGPIMNSQEYTVFIFMLVAVSSVIHFTGNAQLCFSWIKPFWLATVHEHHYVARIKGH